MPGLSPDPCIYFCGNSLGLQPKATARYLEVQLDTWSSVGVEGHFIDLEDSPLSQWQLLAEQAATSMSKMVGAAPDEVAAMGSLTANLHLLLASFYRPVEGKHKILLDWKAFPSDHVGSPHAVSDRSDWIVRRRIPRRLARPGSEGVHGPCWPRRRRVRDLH